MTTQSFKGARLTRPLVLAIDLDETFADSPVEARNDLFSLLEAHADDVQLVYMTHEPVEKLIELAANAELPVPAVFMADSGTTVLKGDATGTVEPLQRNIIQLWPGNEAVQKVIDSIDGIEAMEDGALCRMTISVDGAEALTALGSALQQLGCHHHEAGEGSYYVLPYGVDKGTTLGRFIVEANVNPNNVVSIAEAAGDDCLFGRGWRGAVFGHGVEPVRELGARFHNVVVLDDSGAPAVLEALRQHNWLEMAASE